MTLQWIEEASGTLGQRISGLGQVPPTDWTGVPKPPFWDATGLAWPPTGPLPATPPPGWYLIANLPPPPGWTTKWPPDWPPTAADVPGWPAGWPFPLPAVPAAGGPPLPTPPGATQTTQPPAPAVKGGGGIPTGVAVALGLGLLGLILLAATGAPPLAENPCGCCGGVH